ncbi:MAG: outer membrane lipoprotein carrier protein LolA [Bacteroidota bacterium]
MTKLLNALFILYFLGTSAGGYLSAQPGGETNNYLSAADSDPAALRLVESLRAKYEGYSTIEADFRLEIDIPGSEVEVQSGTLARQGDKFYFQLGTQEGISDGEAIYFILHGSKEIQISDLPEEGETDGLLTPQSIFSFYDSGSFIIALQGEETQDGRLVQVLELKPEDRNNSDFTKMRMLVDKNRKEVVKVLAFGRDGSRFTFYLDNTQANQSIPASRFTYNKDNYEGYYETDLRF